MTNEQSPKADALLAFIPVHAIESIPTSDLKIRAVTELIEAEERAIEECQKKINLELVYAKLSHPDEHDQQEQLHHRLHNIKRLTENELRAIVEVLEGLLRFGNLASGFADRLVKIRAELAKFEDIKHGGKGKAKIGEWLDK